MKKGVHFFGKTILFTAIVSMGFMVNDADAQRGGRDGGGNRGGGGGRSQGPSNGGGRSFGGGNSGGSRSFGGGNSPGRSADRGSFSRGNSAPVRNVAPSRSYDRRPVQITNNRPQQITGRGPSYNSGSRSPYRGSTGYYNQRGPGRSYAYNRPVQVRGNYGRPNVNINIGIGGGYRYNPRFYYGGGYHYRPSYYRPFFAPTFGLRINVLPFGYTPFYYSSIPYYFYDGVYYRQYDNYYQTVEPPLGAKLPTLPSGAEAVLIDGQNYYEYKGTYYQKTYGDNGDTLYEVVGTDGVLETDKAVQNEIQSVEQAGDVFFQLPEGTRTIQLDGKTYFVSPGGDYYEQFIDKDDKVYYVKAGAEAPQN